MWTRSFRTCCSRAGGILLLAMLASCGRSGPELAPVSGRVTLDERPLESADVVFQPEGMQRPSVGRTDNDGRYELAHTRGVQGAIAGPHTVRITVSSEVVRNPPAIPARYNTASELRAEVEPDTENIFNFNLTSNPK